MGDRARDHVIADELLAFAAEEIAAQCPGRAILAVALTESRLQAHVHRKTFCSDAAIDRLTRDIVGNIRKVRNFAFELEGLQYSGFDSTDEQTLAKDTLLSTFVFIRHAGRVIGALATLVGEDESAEEAEQLLAFAATRLSESFGKVREIRHADESSEPVDIRLSGSEILIVGNQLDKNILRIAKHVRAIGFRPTWADSTLTGYRSATTSSPRLIFIDEEIAGSTIGALLELLRSDPRTRSSGTVVVRSSSGSAASSGQALGTLTPLTPADDIWDPGIFGPHIAARIKYLLETKRRDKGERLLLALKNAEAQSKAFTQLSNTGFAVRESSHESMIDDARAYRPAIVISDSEKTSNGSDILAILRSNPATSLTSLFRCDEQHLSQLQANILELLCRRDKELGSSPNTGLPGSNAISREVNKRLLFAPQKWAFCYLDLDHFKSFNDEKGCALADSVIRSCAEVLTEAVHENAPGSFTGHIAGDDFFFVVPVRDVDKICNYLCRVFDSMLPSFYGKSDRENGYIEAVDRYGDLRKFPLLSISVVAITKTDKASSYTKLTEVAATYKRLAKRSVGSSYIRDGRFLLGRTPRKGRTRSRRFSTWIRENLLGQTIEDGDQLKASKR